MLRPSEFPANGLSLKFSDDYIANLEKLKQAGSTKRLTKLGFMHRKIVTSNGLPIGSYSVSPIIDKISVDEWQETLDILDTAGLQWKDALLAIQGQRIFEHNGATIIYTLIRKEEFLEIILAEFFFGPTNHVGPGSGKQVIRGSGNIFFDKISIKKIVLKSFIWLGSNNGNQIPIEYIIRKSYIRLADRRGIVVAIIEIRRQNSLRTCKYISITDMVNPIGS